MKNLLGLVHDVHDDRRALYAQIAQRVDEFAPTPFDEQEARLALGKHEACREALDERARLLEQRPTEAGLTVGELAALAADEAVPALASPASFARVSLAQLRSLHEALTVLRPLARLWGPDSRWRAPDGSAARASFAGWGDAELRGLEREVAQALEHARHHERLQAASPVPGEAVERARTGLADARATRAARQGRVEPQLLSTLLPLEIGRAHV